MLITQNITKQNYSKELLRLYNDNFPVNERVPFERLIKGLDKGSTMTAYYDKDEFIGFTYLYHYQKLTYFAYLVIEEKHRGKGYATQIIQHIQATYPHKIVLDIECLDPSAHNADQRKKRRDLYLKNGFVSTNVFYYFYHVNYELLSCHGLCSAKEYSDLIITHWGAHARKAQFYDDKGNPLKFEML
ncbi:MAG: GNAT family N-acetyltransferase [Erysipelotrichaceae bacterium]|nr:GNAT family N-acetyltransferase [Erysipelotrichaceae bacterium]